ncbi:MAG: hypothetical protein WC947_05730 [Elusimicrobiota bacterium]
MSKILDFVSNFACSDEEMSQKKEVRKMKKLLCLLLVITASVSIANAAISTDTCVMTVTPVVGYSIKIDTENVTRDFGVVNLGQTSSDLFIATVTNNGNVTEGIAHKGSSSTNWTLAAGPGADIFGLNICLVNQPGGASYAGTAVSTVTTVKTNSEVNTIAVNVKKNLWGKIQMPASSGVTTQQSFTLSLYAVPTF